MAIDTLSDVLQAVRLRGAVFFAIDGSAPWLAESPAGRAIAPHIMPGAEHTIEYHVVTSGACWGGIVDEPPTRLEAGDIIVFPQGDPHVISSAPGLRGDLDLEVFRSARTHALPIDVHLDGGGADRATVICGFLGLDAKPFNPLLAALPRVLVVRGAGPDDGLRRLVALALAESTSRREGSDAALARLSELLFVEVVRRHLATLPHDTRGWLAGLRDEVVGRALGRLHERPAHDWTLEELARVCSASRSVLAERFTQLVGAPPMQYLARWRMQLAAPLLAGTSTAVAEIAERVGYGSEAAFSRAFQRELGTTPAAWRRAHRPRGS
ncbi:MAG TPA: AraC family transcriptional regulator [Polyangia bacterium]|nr:AraC family transcriptional regulator [Polyangia bacterium]